MITETMPLNQWPLESLIKLKALVDVNLQQNWVPEHNIQAYQEMSNVLDRAIDDQKVELSKLPF